jgi:hypothetical protein
MWAVTVLATGLILASCEGFVTYTVVNDTDHTLLTWTGTRSCGATIGKRQDYGSTDVVRPRTTFEYFRNVGGTGPYPRCVYIATADRRIVAAERYRDDGIFTINEPLSPGAYFPDRDELPRKSWWAAAKDYIRTLTPSSWVLYVVGLPILFGMVMGFGAALIQFARWMRTRDAST